ncbi:MBL fold metallo-hydrolase [Phosphitispora fastidiosa]|uniref:MBL fold metallo-hydrolase n=1 Tax=Phosphitispora fastidiosa TaxID=2837202 RepID=UPI001E44FCFA|nr:MBL fold metallo-hydrolase [Phosphitispora fastidiosa]MBU7006862.1 ribonuclease BN (tRNA processing enzyme) [Phosphitispora fastidiosa]
MKIIFLGSGGWIPTFKRQTCSFLLITDRNLILLDAGSGIWHLGNHTDLLKKYSKLDIIFSHYHLDHVMGLAFLPNWVKGLTLNIWGPGKKFYCNKCEDILTQLTSSPYFSLPIQRFSDEVIINDYDLNGFNIGNLAVEITAQQHSDPSFGITVNGLLHYATDTTVLKTTFEKARDVKLLLHECWDIDRVEKSEHSSLDEIEEMLSNYEVPLTGLIHINPNWGQSEFDKAIKRINGSKIFLARDDIVVNL